MRIQSTDWYVVQVMRGREEAMVELIGRVVPGCLLSECFYPQFATETKVRGAWVPTTRPLFPGYLIAVTRDPVALEDALVRMPEFARVLMMDDRPVPLAHEEVELIGGLTKPGERTVPMSRAVKVGDDVVITSSPLVGHEGLIREINRRKSVAYLEIDLCGRKVSTRVGIAVLSSPEAPEARAAVVCERASERANEIARASA